jgi:putative SOS response-associated peptidase YedK
VCGRFTLTASGEELAEAFGLDDQPELAPRYNIAPTQSVAVVRAEGPGGRRALSLLRWGLLPRATAEPKRPLINARAETASSTPSFREAFARRRCLIPASGFFEWTGAGKKRQPWYFRMASGRVFAFAGLWEPPFDPVERPTATILTTEPNTITRPVHDRMPVILAPEDYARWLDPQAGGWGALRGLLLPFPADAMAAYPVEPVVNNPRHDEPSCITPSTSLM